MTSLAGCAGGGWTMVMKVNGSKVSVAKKFSRPVNYREIKGKGTDTDEQYTDRELARVSISHLIMFYYVCATL